MATFQVRRELTATRCEICHQADLFEPGTGRCVRCAEIAISTLGEGICPMQTLDVRRGRSGLRWLKLLPFLFILLGIGSITLFISDVFGIPFHLGNSNQTEFRIPEIGFGKTKPSFDVRDGELEIAGMLSQEEQTGGVRIDGVRGTILESGRMATFEGLGGYLFLAKIGQKEVRCFCSLDDPPTSISLNFWLMNGKFIVLNGQYDTANNLLFVSKIIIRETPFRGDELPQS